MESKKVIGERLKKARERLGISLADISGSTRINVSFLSAIEEGRMPEVPGTYLRAFIKAFAEQVELDPKEIAEGYFRIDDAPPPPPVENPERPRVPSQEEPPRKPAPKMMQSNAQRQMKVLFVISVALIASLALLVLILRSGRPGSAKNETPFNDVVKEQEAKLSPAPKDSLSTPAAAKAAVPDTLRLEAVASESVWVHIVIDNAVTKEYLFAPKRRLQWKAKTSFLLSVGNVSALSLWLNGTKLETIGPPSKPAKNVLISKETMKQFTKEASRKEKE